MRPLFVVSDYIMEKPRNVHKARTVSKTVVSLSDISAKPIILTHTASPVLLRFHTEKAGRFFFTDPPLSRKGINVRV